MNNEWPRMSNKHMKEELLITLATEIAVLEMCVHFTKQLDYTDHEFLSS